MSITMTPKTADAPRVVVAPAGGPPAPAPSTASVTTRVAPTAGHNVRRWVVLAVLAVVALVIAWTLRPKPTPVDVGIASAGPIRVTVNADAVTRVVNHFAVSAPVTGLVRRITLSEGEVVKTGDVVAYISTSPAGPAELRVADARLEAARASRQLAAARIAQTVAALAQAERDAARTRRLVEAGALADREVELSAISIENRRADRDAALAQLRVADAELAQARTSAEALRGTGDVVLPIRAPAAGRVLRIADRSARVVPVGAPLMEIGDPGSLEVAADVLSSDAASIRPGQEVTLAGWGGAPLRAVVRRVEPSARTRISALGVEEQRLTVVMDVIDPPAALGDGYRLDASIVVWSAQKTLVIPASALLRDGGRWQAWVIRDGRAARRTITVGHLGGGMAEVLRGVQQGDSVVVFPAEALRDGVRVKGV